QASPDIPEYRANLAAALVERARANGADADAGLLAEAIAQLQQAAALGPRLPLVHNNLGLALQLSGAHDEALAAFAEALAIDDDDAPARFNRAASLRALGREPEVLAEIDELLRRHPTFAPALRGRCTSLARLGRAKEARLALQVYRRAVPDAVDLEELE